MQQVSITFKKLLQIDGRVPFHMLTSQSPGMNYTVVVNGAVWLGATAYYFIDARKWFTGPKITVDLDLLTEEQEQAIREEGVQVEGLEGQGISHKRDA